MKLKMHEIGDMLNAKFSGSDAIVSGVSFDTRDVKAGDLFVALKGEQVDSHDLLYDAKEKGAEGVLISRQTDVNIPHIIVKDTYVALGELASLWRGQFDIPMIGLTGSCGKTTTKSMIASILSQHHKVLAPRRSMNTNIGVPITLLQLTNEHQFALIEMGTNHFGEISYLTKIVRPDVALITNINSAHVEFFKDLNGVVRAKSEIFEGLSDEGVAILNADDPYTEKLKTSLDPGRRIIYFGTNDEAQIRGSNIVLRDGGYIQFTLTIDGENIPVNLPLLGEHNVSNALAAAAVASSIGIDNIDIKAGLENVKPVNQRLVKRVGLNDITVIDDSYSAIPEAVNSALSVLSCAKGEKVFVFGGMAELNVETAAMVHEEVGKTAKEFGVDRLFAVGNLSQHTVDAFGEGAEYFSDKDKLIKSLLNILHPGMTVLVKGSRGARMEDVVAVIARS